MSSEIRSPCLLSRRDFIRLVGGLATLGVASFILWPRTAFANVPPPGAILPVALFQASCNRCGKCVATCPHNAIRQNNEGLPLSNRRPSFPDRTSAN